MNKEIDYGTKGYGCVVMSVAGFALLIALIALRKWDTPLFGLSASDVTVTDTLSLLVTILIGWQIWQTIASREEIKKATAAAEEVEILKKEFNRRIDEMRWLAVGFYNEHQSEKPMSSSNRFWHIATTAGAYISAHVPRDFRPLDDALAEMERILESLKINDLDNKKIALSKSHERAKLSGSRKTEFYEWYERVNTLIDTEAQYLANAKDSVRRISNLYHQITNY